MRKLMCAAAVCALAVAASADAAVLGTGGLATGSSFTVNLAQGIVGGNVQPGLTSAITYTFNGISTATIGGQDYSLFNITASVENTSSAPITASRVSAIGFNTDPNAVVGQSSSTGVYTNVSSGTVPQIGSFEFCATAGANCAGGAGGGVEFGNTGVATLSLAFLGDGVESITLSDFFGRYQSIMINGQGDFSGVGVVPLPAALPLLLSALAGLGVMARLRSAKREDEVGAPVAAAA